MKNKIQFFGCLIKTTQSGPFQILYIAVFKQKIVMTDTRTMIKVRNCAESREYKSTFTLFHLIANNMLQTQINEQILLH
jgi:hypothetical protein